MLPACQPPHSYCYVGEAGGIEAQLAARHGIPFRSISTGQIRGRTPWTAARNLIRMARGARECGAVIRSFRPHVALVTGGYVAAPVAWAAARNGVPLLIYLPDLTPGSAIKWTSRLADRVAVSFPEVAKHFPGKAVVTGYPVRPELTMTGKDAARRALGLDTSAPVVLVFGGSRGARSINQALIASLPAVLPLAQVIHVTGQLDWDEMEREGERFSGEAPDLSSRYHAYPYLHDEMLLALAAADLVVARAGASVLGEFPAVGMPAILVPYPYAGQHQDANASYLADRGAALVLRDSELRTRLGDSITQLITDRERLATMARAALSLARPDAAVNIARELCLLARE